LTATLEDAAGNTATNDSSTVVTFGQASGLGSVTGAGTATVAWTGASWDGQPVPAVSARAASDGRTVAATFAAPELNTTGNGTLTLAGDQPFEVSATIAGLTLDPMRPWLPTPWDEATAQLSATLSATGQARDPRATTTATATIDALTASLDEATLALDGSARVVANSTSVTVDALRLRTGTLSAVVDGTLATDTSAARPLTARVQGGLESLRPWADALGSPLPALSGSLDLQAQVAGTLERPAPSATLALTDVTVDVAGDPLRVATAAVRVRDGLATLDETTATWRSGSATIAARAPLRLLESLVPGDVAPWFGTAAGPAELSARAADLQIDLLEPFVGAEALENVSGTVSATLQARATGPTLADVSGRLTLDEARATLQGIPLAQARPTVVTLSRGELRVDDALFSGANTDLAVDGVAQLTGDAPSLDAQLRGLTDLALLQPFLDGIAPGGRAE
ncbi:MAG: hypothetical protein ACLGHP_11720, partial [Vicinamibacteria bacterium]